MLGDLFNKIRGLFGTNSPQLVKPVPMGDDLTSPAIRYQYANDQSRQEAAGQPSIHSYIQPSATPTPTPSPTPAVHRNINLLDRGDNLTSYFGPNGQVMTPQIHPVISNLIGNALLQHIQKGLAGTPAAAYAPQFAQAGQGLPDPLMPAVLSRKETGGGKKLADKNNYLNIQYNGINNSPYETPEDNIVGGDGHKGFVGVIHNPLYNDYLKSGDLNDFFKHYTPHQDKNGHNINGSYQDQINQYNAIRHEFE